MERVAGLGEAVTSALVYVGPLATFACRAACFTS